MKLAQFTRQMREQQLPRAFYNKFSHNFKLLSYSDHPFVAGCESRFLKQT